MSIPQNELDEDALLLKRMQELQSKLQLSLEEQKELDQINHKYYVENYHIRLYWKLY